MNPEKTTIRCWRNVLFLVILLINIDVFADTVEVKISGIEGDLLQNATLFISLLQNTQTEEKKLPIINRLNGIKGRPLPSADLSERQLKRAHRLAPKEIAQALQPYGYYAPDIQPRLSKTSEGWLAEYIVDPGQPTIVNSLDIQNTGAGKDDEKITAAWNTTSLSPNRQLSHLEYEETKKALVHAAFESGYLDAGFTRSEILVDADRNSAEIILHFDSGPQFYFGEVDIQQTALDRTIVKRFLPFQTGDPFDSEKLVELQLSLEDTDYFSEVNVRALRDQVADFQIPIEVHAASAKPQQYTIGAGFGTDTGPRVNAGVNVRRLNKRGHQLRADARASAIGASIQSQYLIPINRGTKDHIGLTAAITREDIADTKTESVLVGIGRYESWRGFQRQLYLNYESEKFDLGEGGESIQLLTPGITLSRMFSDDLVFPRRGFSIDLDLHGASESFASDTNFLQGKVLGNAVWPLGEKGRLLLRGEYGATQADNFDLLPLSQRFFAGGDRSVRGYDYQEISPVNDSGRKIGGQYLAVFSAEVDYLVYKDYGIAAFIDAGNASDEAFPELKQSIGIGARYRSPIGMIRLDVAHPLEDEEHGYRIHVSIGADL